MTGTAPQPGAAGPSGGPARDRYLVGADDPALLRELACRLARQTGQTAPVRLIRVIGEPASALAVDATRDGIDDLRRADDRLLIEPDASLPQPLR